MACEDYYGEEPPSITELEMQSFFGTLDKKSVIWIPSNEDPPPNTRIVFSNGSMHAFNEYDEWGTHYTSTMCGVMPYDLEYENRKL